MVVQALQRLLVSDFCLASAIFHVWCKSGSGWLSKDQPGCRRGSDRRVGLAGLYEVSLGVDTSSEPDNVDASAPCSIRIHFEGESQSVGSITQLESSSLLWGCRLEVRVEEVDIGRWDKLEMGAKWVGKHSKAVGQ